MNTTNDNQRIHFPKLIEGKASLTMMEKVLLGNFIALTHPRLILELGVLRALTTRFMCDFMSANKIEGCVIGFDLPEVIAQLRQENEIIQLENRGVLRLIPGRLPDSLIVWLTQTNEHFELALIDATHDYHSVKGELGLLWPRLSKEGFILCHDYSEKYDGVRYAVDSFASEYGAMTLPLVSSEQARKNGISSVLVAIAPRSYHYRISHFIHHRWLAAKTDLLTVPFVRTIWRYIRPFVK